MNAQLVAQLAGQGRYWWATPTGGHYATAEKTPVGDFDVYLLDASPAWVAQWDGDWTKAAEQINSHQED